MTIFNSLKDFFHRLIYYKRIIPPRRLRRSRHIKEFLTDGHAQLQRLIKYASLNPRSNILDIGCGGGKLVSAIVPFLKEGKYSTFEVNKNYVEYWKNSVGKKHNNFTFIHADLWHSYYNPDGKYKTVEYIFPFDNNVFDIVYLNSIFTHLLPSEMSHYLCEIKRVLRPGGVVLATYFIVNNESLFLDNKGLSNKALLKQYNKLLNFQYGNYWTRDGDITERFIGIDEKWLKDTHNKNNLETINIIYGNWCGRDESPDKTLQDIFVARKRY